MKTILKISTVTIALVLMLIADIPLVPVHLVSEADAIYGVRRRTRRRTAVVVGSAATAHTVAAQQQTAAAQQEATAAKQEAAAAQQEAAAAKQQAAAAAPPAPQPAGAGKPLPLGTVVSALPGGCVATPVGGVEYYYCAGNFYRAAFQGNTLVYVTAQPK